MLKMLCFFLWLGANQFFCTMKNFLIRNEWTCFIKCTIRKFQPFTQNHQGSHGPDQASLSMSAPSPSPTPSLTTGPFPSAHGPGPHVSPLGPSTPAPVVSMPQQGRSSTPHSPALPGHGATLAVSRDIATNTKQWA